MGSSPKSMRSRSRCSSTGAAASAVRSHHRSVGFAMLLLAGALAMMGVVHLQSMYRLTQINNARMAELRGAGGEGAAAAAHGSGAWPAAPRRASPMTGPTADPAAAQAPEGGVAELPGARAAAEFAESAAEIIMPPETPSARAAEAKPEAPVAAAITAQPAAQQPATATEPVVPVAAAAASSSTAAAAAAAAEAAAAAAAADASSAEPAAVPVGPAATVAVQKRDAVPVPQRALMLATHSRLLWYDPDTGKSRILHEGEGVHYGMFPGEGAKPTTVWTAIRPHNWRPTTTHEYLVEFDMATGEELKRVEIPARFTHDVVRAGDHVYVCDTGNGQILDLSFPRMQLLRTMPLFTLKDHVNTLAPYRPNEMLAVLHNLGSSDIVRVDTTQEPAKVVGRLQGIGRKAHGLVKWHGGYVFLDSDNGALSILRVGGPGGASVRRLWQAPEAGRFLKGLTVVDDVAYFGVSEWAPRSARDDPRTNCELAAFDLLEDRLLWRREVPTAGLLNIVGAPHLAEDSTYRASYTPSRAPRTHRALDSEAVVSAALKYQESLGYHPKVGGYWSSGQPYLDASAKATRTPWDSGLQLPLMRLDVSEAKRFLLSLAPETWTHEYQAVHSAVMAGRDTNMNAFKPGVQGITLLFSAGSGDGPVYEFPLYKKFAPVLNPLIEEVIGKPDMANIIRLQLALMKPKVSDIKIHVDTGGYATYGHRIHIPLMTNEGVDFMQCPFKDEAKTQQVCHKIPTTEGFVFELNNKVPHRVSNLGDTDRVHLVVDLGETPHPRVPLDPGTTCEYDVNHGLFCGTQEQQLLRAIQEQQARQAAAARQQQQQQQQQAAALLQLQQLQQRRQAEQARLEAAAAAAGSPAGLAYLGPHGVARPSLADDDLRLAGVPLAPAVAAAAPGISGLGAGVGGGAAGGLGGLPLGANGAAAASVAPSAQQLQAQLLLQQQLALAQQQQALAAQQQRLQQLQALQQQQGVPVLASGQQGAGPLVGAADLGLLQAAGPASHGLAI